jgi:phospholipid/cholesterol/gamma-HCH transport system substrate-binding protein
MDERVMQFRVGVVVFATLILAMTLILMFSDTEFGGLLGGEYVIRMHFPQAPGVAERTPVRLSGVLIGRVKSVQLVDDGVVVEAAISDKYRIRIDDRARIGGGSLLGDAVITIVRSQRPQEPVRYVTDGGEIEGDAAPSLFEVVDQVQNRFDTLAISLTQTSDDIGGLARGVRNVVDDNDERVRKLLEAAQRSMEQMAGAAQNVGITAQKIGVAAEELNKVVGNPEFQRDLRQSANMLPELFEEARGVVANVRNTMQSAERNFRNLESFTQTLGEKGGPVLENADRLFNQLGNSSEKLDQLLENLVVFSEALNRSDSSVGRLLNDDTLYHNVNDLIENVNRITYEIRPVIRDARLFADKLARHPETLGVAGALRGRGSGAKPVIFGRGDDNQDGGRGGLFGSGSSRMIDGEYCPTDVQGPELYYPSAAARARIRTTSASSTLSQSEKPAAPRVASRPATNQPLRGGAPVVSGGKETTTSPASAPQQTEPAKPATNEGTQKAPRLKPVGGPSAGGNYSPNTSYMSRYPYSN